jgi:hypothetical protein
MKRLGAMLLAPLMYGIMWVAQWMMEEDIRCVPSFKETAGNKCPDDICCGMIEVVHQDKNQCIMCQEGKCELLPRQCNVCGLDA